MNVEVSYQKTICVCLGNWFIVPECYRRWYLDYSGFDLYRRYLNKSNIDQNYREAKVEIMNRLKGMVQATVQIKKEENKQENDNNKTLANMTEHQSVDRLRQNRPGK